LEFLGSSNKSPNYCFNPDTSYIAKKVNSHPFLDCGAKIYFQIFFIASARSIFIVLHEFQLNVRSFILLIDATTFCLANISHVKKSSPSKQATALHV